MAPGQTGTTRCLCVLLMVWLTYPAVSAASSADLDGDGTVDASDVYLFAVGWMTDPAAADGVTSGGEDRDDLLELVRTFKTQIAAPTPSPLPAPVWTHPSLEDMWEVFYTEYGQEDDFLDWSDVPGAAAYEVVADITRENAQVPTHKTWLVEATQTPGVPVSNSRVHHISPSTDLLVVQVRALTGDATPERGSLSDQRAFYLSLLVPPTYTPTPTVKPTLDIDFSGDEVTDRLDVFYLQRSWLTRLGNDAHYDPAVAVLAEPTTEVDAGDVQAFVQEYKRQRIPIPAPVLVSPASGAIISYTAFMVTGMTFDWEPVPEVSGGIFYKLRVTGPIGSGTSEDCDRAKLEDSEYTGTFYRIPPPDDWPLTEYHWKVMAESKYGIYIHSEWSTTRVFYVEQDVDGLRDPAD